MLNKAQIIGRLGRDVEIRSTQSGQPVANFTVATDESYTDGSGQRVEATEWHRVTAYGKTAENCGKFIGKGSLVYVDGRIRSRKYTDRDGQERQITEIRADRVLFLDKRQQEAPAPAPKQPQQTQQEPGWDECPF